MRRILTEKWIEPSSIDFVVNGKPGYMETWADECGYVHRKNNLPARIIYNNPNDKDILSLSYCEHGEVLKVM